MSILPSLTPAFVPHGVYTNPPPPWSGVPFRAGLTQRVVEGAGDRRVPLALEEAQAGGGHGVLVLPVEVHRLEGAVG